eukprot:g8027.t1
MTILRRCFRHFTSLPMTESDVCIVAISRTPIGIFQGCLSSFSATELGSEAIKGLLEKSGVDPSLINEAYIGNVLSANLGQAPAKQACLGGGLPPTLPCTTINKVCASGLKSVMLGVHSIQSGFNSMVLAGGMESMSNVPHYLPESRTGTRLGHMSCNDGLIKDGLWDPYTNQHMGSCAELCARDHGLTRQMQDDYALESFRRSRDAIDDTKWEITPIIVRDKRTKECNRIMIDEGIERLDEVKLRKLRTVFDEQGTVTAGNSSQISDGAAMVLLVKRSLAQKLNLPILATILETADAAQIPEKFPTTPTLAIQKLMDNVKTRSVHYDGLKIEDIDVFEINEAFAAVVLANQKLLDLDPDKVNVHGGAVAVGHPLGCSGTRILIKLINVLRIKKKRFGIAAICNGGGGASATAKLESVVLDIVWAGNRDAHLYLLTLGPQNITGGKVWLSKDSGLSFEDMTERLYGKQLLNKLRSTQLSTLAALPEETKQEESSFGVVKVFVSKSNPRNIFLQGAGRFNWLSSDRGRTVRAVKTPGRTTGTDHVFKMHPEMDSWALALVEREECDDPLQYLTSACAKDLFLTMDLWNVHLWTNLTQTSEGRVSAFVDFEWGEIARQASDSRRNTSLPSRSVLATVYESTADMKGPYMGWDKDTHFVESNDFFASPHTNLVPCGTQFEAISGVIFLGVSNACPVDIKGQKREVKGSSDWLSGVTLYISTNNGRNFTQACVRVPLEQAGYTLVLTHDRDGMFLIVQHLVESSMTRGYLREYISNVYASGDNAALFSLSFQNINIDAYSGVADFSLIRGLPGAYIANKAITIDDLPLSSGAFETKITYNGGVSWESISAPDAFTHEECNQCPQGQVCSLHLHGPSSWGHGPHSRPSVYSHQNAPGLITGVGIVDVHASAPDHKDKLCTWLSSDGGVTWKDVAIGAFSSEFGDYGGFILLAKHSSDGPANEVLLSTDEGHCWNSIPLQQALMVDNIRMEPDGQRPRFIIHGKSCTKSELESCGLEAGAAEEQGLVYTLDVQDLLNFRKCDESDYEMWIPLDNKKSNCLLGSIVPIEKRRRFSKCLNGAHYNRKRFDHRPCECSEDDVICDFGYIKTGAIQTKDCTKIDPNLLPSCPVVDEKEYSPYETGKRLVHNTECLLTEAANYSLFYSISNTSDSRSEPHSDESTSKVAQLSGDEISDNPSLHKELLDSSDDEQKRKRKKSLVGVWVALIVFFAFFVVIAGVVIIVRRRVVSLLSFDEYDHTSFWDSILNTMETLKNKFFKRTTQNEAYFVPLH